MLRAVVCEMFEKIIEGLAINGRLSDNSVLYILPPRSPDKIALTGRDKAAASCGTNSLDCIKVRS